MTTDEYFNKLEGTGKDMRHLKFSGVNEVNQFEVVCFLKQAIELDKELT